MGIAGGGIPYKGLYGEDPPKRGAFFALAVCERVGKFTVLVTQGIAEMHVKLEEIVAKTKY